MDRLAFETPSMEAQGTREREQNGHHLPELLALEDLADLGSHLGELWIERDELIEDGGIGHDGRHVL